MSDFWTEPARCTCVYKIVYQHFIKPFQFFLFFVSDKSWLNYMLSIVLI